MPCIRSIRRYDIEIIRGKILLTFRSLSNTDKNYTGDLFFLSVRLNIVNVFFDSGYVDTIGCRVLNVESKFFCVLVSGVNGHFREGVVD